VNSIIPFTRRFQSSRKATDDPAVNHAVFADGEAAGVWVNSADDPANCAFTLPARIRRGDLLVTVSTGGTSPALASWLRGRLDADLGPEFATLLDILSEERNALKAAGRSTEGLDWQSALESGMLDLVREGRLAEAKERLQACLSSSSG
jgi:precorrin-2 dehydrogenase/sirohydrochlorin ferrochelatase